jgi:hypothetical protein
VLGVNVIRSHERHDAGQVSGRVVLVVRPEPVHGEEPGENGWKEEREMGRALVSGAFEFPSHVM